MNNPNINEMLRDDFAVDPTADGSATEENLADSLGLSKSELDSAIERVSSMADEYFEQSISVDYAAKILTALHSVGFKFDSKEDNLRSSDQPNPIEAIAKERDNLLSNHVFLFRLFGDTLINHREHFQHILKVTDGIGGLLEELSLSQLKAFLHLIRSQCDRSITGIDKLRKIELGNLYVGENYDDSIPQ